jgi:acetyltransferase
MTTNTTSDAGSPRFEPVHDILKGTISRPLDCIFSPKAVALIGATESPNSVGRTVLENLQQGQFAGPIYPINPKREQVLGLKAYPSILAAPGKVDLAVVVTPPPSVPGIIRDCVQFGVRGAIIISAGFKEIGPAGLELERQVLEEARRGQMRVVGPNCLGVMVPTGKLNATFAAGMARPGSVGFISQSGALCTAVLDWSLKENVGFSAFVSIGSMVDVGWGDLIFHLGDDPATRSIVIYMESIGDARAFLSAAREVALTKPIIVIKPGRSSAAAKAAASHTGSLTGSDEVLQAAFQRAGVLRVENISELFDMAEVLSKQPRPLGPHLTIITNAGGPAVLATDMLITGGGLLAELQPETMTAFNQICPPTWSHNNPVDIIGDAGPDLYAKAVEIASKDPNTDGMLVILTPQAMTKATETAEALKPYSHLDNKPLLASWMGADAVAAGEDILNAANVPTFKYPDRAAKAFCYMWKYTQNLRALYETPSQTAESEDVARVRNDVDAMLKAIRHQGRSLLTELESKQLLAAQGIPTVETHVATTEAEAVRIATKLGFPVVLKLYSETITHKTDVGGVQLNLRNPTSVRRAWRTIQSSVAEKVGQGHFMGVTVQPMIKLDGYELIIGSSIDPQFGPVLLFGTGGQLVEVYKDRALALPPLNATLARRMMEGTHIFTALKGVRGRASVDIAALEQLLVRFSELVVAQPWIKEIDINPLIAAPGRLLALDARVVLHDPKTPEDSLPRASIRAYPAQYVGEWKSKNKKRLVIRPIRPEDEPLMVKFHHTLSEQSVYQRYFNVLHLSQRTAHDRLTRICFNDYDREIALVAEHRETPGAEARIVAVGRLSKLHGVNEGEFALLVSDPWQGVGLGTELLKRLVQVGREEKLQRITGHILADNQTMKLICQQVGFTVGQEGDKRDLLAEYKF